MTLLVADCRDSVVWMAADTGIFGGTTEIRSRENDLKIFRSGDGRGLIGYAGDQHYGVRVLLAASRMPSCAETAEFILQEHLKLRTNSRDDPSADFSYAYLDENDEPRLQRIARGHLAQQSSFYLGQKSAFEKLQTIRHDPAIDAAPDAVKFLFTGSRAPEPVPPGLAQNIGAMLRLIAEGKELDVGGWATGYFLTRSGAFACGYGYSVSDPTLPTSKSGSVVAHGSASGGGFSLSVTELSPGNGLVVYWLQKPGGVVFKQDGLVYQRFRFDGRPTEFIDAASSALGQKVEILVSDLPMSTPERLSILRGEDGTPSIVIAHTAKSFSISVLNVAEVFRTRAELPLAGPERLDPLSFAHAKLDVSEGSDAVTLALLRDGSPSNEVRLTPGEVDRLIQILGEVRLRLKGDEPPPEPPQEPGTQETVVIDPIWRTGDPIHPSLQGIMLRLRHPGFGWLTFLVPWHEVANLGEWLINALKRHRETPNADGGSPA